MILISFVMLVLTGYLGVVYHASTTAVPTILTPLLPYVGCGMGGVAAALSWVAWCETGKAEWRVLACSCLAAALTSAALLFLHFDSFFYRKEGLVTLLALGALIAGIAAGITSLLALKEAKAFFPEVSGYERGAVVPWILIPMAAVEELSRAGMHVWLVWVAVIVIMYTIIALQNYTRGDAREEEE